MSKMLKKVVSTILLITSLATPLMATPTITPVKYPNSGTLVNYLICTINASDYSIIDGKAYVPLSTVSDISDTALGLSCMDDMSGIYTNYDSNTGVITIINNMIISSSRGFTATLKVNDLKYQYDWYFNVDNEVATAPPKVVGNTVYIPVKTLALLFNYGAVNIDPKTKAISFRISLT